MFRHDSGRLQVDVVVKLIRPRDSSKLRAGGFGEGTEVELVDRSIDGVQDENQNRQASILEHCQFGKPTFCYRHLHCQPLQFAAGERELCGKGI